MFARAYYALRMFARRYWPTGGAAPPPPPSPKPTVTIPLNSIRANVIPLNSIRANVIALDSKR